MSLLVFISLRGSEKEEEEEEEVRKETVERGRSVGEGKWGREGGGGMRRGERGARGIKEIEFGGKISDCGKRKSVRGGNLKRRRNQSEKKSERKERREKTVLKRTKISYV